MDSGLIEKVRREIRRRGYSMSTEKTYLLWLKRFFHFLNGQDPLTAKPDRISDYLTYLAVERHVTVNSQKVVLNALVFFYVKVLGRDIGDLGFKLATRQRYIPTVLSPAEVKQILLQLEGRNQLIIGLLYGSGLRVSEALSIRAGSGQNRPECCVVFTPASLRGNIRTSGAG